MILLVGSSASGKTALSVLLREKYGLLKTVTYTTRKPRIGEKDGLDYHFVSKNLFNEMRSRNEFVETTDYNGNSYGSSKNEISDNKVLIVDPSGLKAYKMLRNPEIISFYLEASEESRINRMKERKDSPENIKARIENDKKVFSLAVEEECDFIIQTDDRSLEAIADEVYKKYQETLKAHS